MNEDRNDVPTEERDERENLSPAAGFAIKTDVTAGPDIENQPPSG